MGVGGTVFRPQAGLSPNPASSPPQGSGTPLHLTLLFPPKGRNNPHFLLLRPLSLLVQPYSQIRRTEKNYFVLREVTGGGI